MPTISGSAVPITKNWDEFEEITRSALAMKWNSPNLTRNGRQGQAQDGVDIYGDNELGQSVGVQCKLVEDLSFDNILSEVSKAEGFQPSLQAYYIATTAPSDAKLQRQVRQLSQDRIRQGKFPVWIFFWNDIIQELVKDPTEFHKYYPQFGLAAGSQEPESTGNREIGLLDLAYFGCHILDYMGLLFGEFSWEPLEFARLLTDTEACVAILFTGKIREQLLHNLEELSNYVLPFANGTDEREEGWHPANQLAATIDMKIKSIEYGLSGREHTIFKVGELLGNWNHREYQVADGKINARSERLLLELIAKVSSNDVVGDIERIIAEYRASDSIETAHTPDRVLQRVRSSLY